ncbi:MAG: hypothetical protein RLZZ437_167 [Pseudomonadota bacterium]
MHPETDMQMDSNIADVTETRVDAADIPELFIFGDSHTAALDLGAKAEGISTGLLYLSGNIWHAGLITIHAEREIDQAGSRYVRRRVTEARAAMGGQLFRHGAPVLASAGYHLGRLLPPMTHRGHTVDEAAFAADPDASFMSSAVLEAMITQRRRTIWRALRRIATRCDLTIIAPPILSDDPMSNMAARMITRRLREYGLQVFDPREVDGPLGRVLPDEWRAEDGVHGNAAYGQALLQHILEP